MSDFASTFRASFRNGRTDAFVAAGVVAVVLSLIIPLPTIVVDVLLAVNLLFSVLIILVVIYTRRVLDFTLFPTLLLVTTVFGLALNISTTRLLLLGGPDAAPAIIHAFASIVIGGGGDVQLINIVVGTIIFIILLAVQFLVITKGATRVAEVAARFTLDGLPAKQMTIDNSFSSGSITEEEATKRKADLQAEVDFFGAMDGASKFVQGNVQVGMIITLVNAFAGIVVGMMFHSLDAATASTQYVSLTIGDGLVSQLPAFLISTATGLLVTRGAGGGKSLGSEAISQFTQQGRIFWIAAGFLGLLGVVPGFPWYVLLPMAALTAMAAYRLQRRETEEAVKKEQAAAGASGGAKTEASKGPETVAPLDPLSLELGYGLIPLVDKEQGAELLERVTRIRRETALDLGLVVPRIRIIDNMRLEPSEYSLKIKGMEVGKGTIRMGCYMAINPGGEREELGGEKTVDPAFGLPAQWITEEQRDKAERAGYTVVDSPSIIATHLTEVIKKHAMEILGRQEVQGLIETVKPDYPTVVEEVNKIFSIGEVQKVLQGLLQEQVSIRNLVVILETLADFGGVTKDTAFLIEKVRQALGRQICLQYADEQKTLHVLTLDPALEQQIIESRHDQVTGPVAALDPEMARQWINAVSNAFRQVQSKGYYPLVLSSEAARPLIKNSTLRDLPDLVVLSVPEVTPGIRVESVGDIRIGG